MTDMDGDSDRKLSVNREPIRVVKVRGQVPEGTTEWLRSRPRCERCGRLVSVCKTFGCRKREAT